MDLPGLDKVGGEEDDAEDNAESSNHDVGNAEEVVLAAHNGTSGDEDGLGASVFGSGEDCESRISTLNDNVPGLFYNIQSSMMIW